MPEFNPDSSTASQELVVACQTDPFCLFDGLVSGDISLASNTLAARREAEVLEELSIEGTAVCVCVCVGGGGGGGGGGQRNYTCTLIISKLVRGQLCPHPHRKQCIEKHFISLAIKEVCFPNKYYTRMYFIFP